MKLLDMLKNIFSPVEDDSLKFTLPADDNSISNNKVANETFNEIDTVKEIFPSIDVNIEY